MRVFPFPLLSGEGQGEGASRRSPALGMSEAQNPVGSGASCRRDERIACLAVGQQSDLDVGETGSL